MTNPNQRSGTVDKSRIVSDEDAATVLVEAGITLPTNNELDKAPLGLNLRTYV